MPAYGTVSPQSLSEGVSIALWNNENVAANANSAAASLKRNPNAPNCFSIELSFAADPGAISIDVQVADTDQDKFYVTKATFTTGLNALFVGRIEAINIVADLVRLHMTTITNAVKVTAMIS